MTYRGTVCKGIIVLEAGATLPEGTSVTVATLDQRPEERTALRRLKAGSAKGKVRMSSDFDEPLPDFAEYTK